MIATGLDPLVEVNCEIVSTLDVHKMLGSVKIIQKRNRFTVLSNPVYLRAASL